MRGLFLNHTTIAAGSVREITVVEAMRSKIQWHSDVGNRCNPCARISTYPSFNFDGRLPSRSTGSRRLPGDFRLSELPAPDRSFRNTLKSRQGGAISGNSRTRTRPKSGY